MGYLAAVLLSYMEGRACLFSFCVPLPFSVMFLLLLEQDAFWVLVTMLNKPKYNLRGMYMQGMVLVRKCSSQLTSILRNASPTLLSHLEAHGVELAVETDKWCFAYMIPSLA